ncbi:persephin [Huso huso]|uniref:Persephin n=1 Tax=Huso huso TaxID=61971 RepID=A0ABR0Y8A2_HUSHU
MDGIFRRPTFTFQSLLPSPAPPCVSSAALPPARGSGARVALTQPSEETAPQRDGPRSSPVSERRAALLACLRETGRCRAGIPAAQGWKGINDSSLSLTPSLTLSPGQMKMRLLLSAAILLGCLQSSQSQGGEGGERRGRAEGPGWIHSLLALRRGGADGPRIRAPRSVEECRLQTLLLQVRELGLGYDSEETVLFKYCSGGCPRTRTNHDLALSVLLQRRAVHAHHSAPCCRPTRHEDVAFLDSAYQWHKVEQLSAAECGCVG